MLAAVWIDAQSVAAGESGQVVFAALVDGSWDLFTTNADGRNLARITETPADERTPVFSADRRRIAFGASDGTVRVREGGRTRTVPCPASTCGHPSWLSESSVVFTCTTLSGRGEDADLCVHHLGEGRSEILLRLYGSQWEPSVAGTRLAFVSGGLVALGHRSPWVHRELWQATIDAGSVAPWRSLAVAPDENVADPAWSPRGDLIALVLRRQDRTALGIMDVASGAVRRLAEDASPKSGPRWSPDGRALLFTRFVDGTPALARVDLATDTVDPFVPRGLAAGAATADADWR